MSTRNFKRNFFIVAGADAVKRIAEWIKHKFYTKAEIDDMLSAGMKYKVVNELPATGEAGTFYLVQKQSAGTGDVYDEYIYVDGSFEHIGSTEIDLSNYYTKTQADDLLDDKVDKVSGKGLSTEDYTTAEKTKLGGIEAGAEVNVQSDWNQSDSTKDDFIKNKPTLRQPSADGTAGQYLKSNGSGNAPSWETMDSSPTANSTKAVTSGGVKTALDGKQASVTITTNANTPTDNDTVIMQDSGNTGTTSFLRRKLSTLWNYFRTKKFPEVNIEWGTSDVIRDVSALDFVSNYRQRGNALPSSAIVYERSTDGGTTWVDDSSHVGFVNQTDRLRITIIGRESDGSMNVIYCQVAKHFINMRAGTCHYALYGINKEGEVTQITSGRVSGNTHPNSIFAKNTYLGYYKTQYQADAYIKHRFEFWQEEGDDTYTGAKYPLYVGLTPKVIWGGNNTLQFGVPYVITTDNTTYKENVKFPQNVEATKFVKTGGTNSQVLLGNGDVMSLPVPINKGGTGATTAIGAEYNILNQVADSTVSTLAGARKVALCNETKSASNGVFRWVTLQKIWDSHIPSFKYTSQEGFGVTIIADLTDSFTNQTWIECGINGIILGHRSGYGQGTIVQRITCWGNRSADTTYLYTDCVDDKAYKPLLLRYNSRYYLAIESTSAAREVLFFGYKANLLDSLIKLYRANGKWYSDSAKTQEVSVEIVKSYSRYPNAYLNFGGTASQVVLGTGELKTIDSSVASGSSNLVTSGAVATAINGIDTSGKVNLQPDFTASQIDYSAGNVGKWQKVLRFPEGADLVINMKKTAMGSDATSTLWFSSSSMGDSYTSLFGNHSVRFVHDGGYVFLVLACRKSTNEPIESYTFQIAHSSVPMSDIVAVTDASPITATPKEPNIVYRAPMTTGAVSFNVTNGAGSVSMSGHNDFLGNMTSEATNGVVVTMSGATEGQIYRFVFTRNITGGVTFKQSNVAYCTIQGDVNAGDTITLTAVSNTADGWLYEQESAGIESSDGSNIVEYNGSTADVRVNWEKLPADLVRNNEWTSSVGHRVLAIGEGASADTASNNVAIGKDADASGNSATCVGGDSEASGTYGTAFGYRSVANVIGATAFGAYAKADGSYSVAIGGTQSNARTSAKGYAVAVGAGSYANTSSVAIGYQSNTKTNSTAVGYQAKAGIPSSDTDRPMLMVFNFEAIQFSEGGSSKFARFCETTDDVTITVNGSDYTLTPPAANKLLFVIDDFKAQYMTSSVTGYAKLNGEDVYINTNYYLTLSKVHLASNKYAVWMDTNANYLPTVITSLYILAYYTTAETITYLTAIGYGCSSAHTMSSAIGINLFAVRGNQTVIGSGNIPDYDAWFIVGAGSNSANGKKNILKIDSSERMVINAGYVGGTQEINMNNQTGVMSNITKSVYRIKWNGTGTVTLTLQASGCVEGQRVTIFAETNDVKLFAQPYFIRQGRFCDFMFLGGAWRPSMGIEELVS